MLECSWQVERVGLDVHTFRLAEGLWLGGNTTYLDLAECVGWMDEEWICPTGDIQWGRYLA